MTHNLEPYPAYKYSGVPWLGEVPEHWEVRRLGTLGMLSASGIDKKMVDREPLVKMINYLDVYNNPTRELRHERRYMTVTCPEWKRTVHGVRRGDIFFTPSSETANDIGWSAVAVDDLANTVYSYHVIRFRLAGEMDIGFRKYWCNNSTVLQQFSLACKGTTRKILTRGDFRNIVITLPPLPEQSAITRFLEYTDRRIWRYIRTKQKLIKLLEEQKQAIIHRAVTRGLDPGVRLKPSGVEWIGDVPAHWILARLKDAAVVQTGLTLGKNYQGAATESRPYLRVANVQHGRVDLKHVKHIDVPLSEAAGATLKAGDVLMTEGGDIDKLGRGCVWRDEIPGCLHQNHVFAVRCRQDVLVPEFLVGLMISQHGRAYFQLTAKQTTNLASTNSTTLRAFPVVLPPIVEQKAILDEAARQTSALDATIARTEHEISLLREYRTRLIADVVTGKFDVRKVASRLPEEIDEQELPEEANDLSNDSEAVDDELAAASEEDDE